jgi:hypothetical protein
MKRGLLNLLTVLSMLLCGAAGALWVRSYFASDAATYARDRVSADGYKRFNYLLISHRGQLVFLVSSQDFRPLPPGVAGRMAEEYRRHTSRALDVHRHNLSPPYMMPAGGWWVRRGFSHSHFGAPQTPTIYNEQSQFAAPHWALVAAAGLLPAAYAVHRWRARRMGRPGVCAKCGYDLRATPDKCPECGTPASVTTVA